MSDKMRSELGCTMMILFTPIFLFGAIILANTSSDSRTTTDVVWSYILFAITPLTFITGMILWMRHR